MLVKGGEALGIRAIFEPALDGRSVIIWEAGSGTRVIYPNTRMAETAFEYLTKKANEFHAAKETNDNLEDELMVSVICYGDQPMTEWAFIRDYIDRMYSIGYDIHAGLVRQAKEFW